MLRNCGDPTRDFKGELVKKASTGDWTVKGDGMWSESRSNFWPSTKFTAKKRSEMKWLASKLSRSGTFSTKYHNTNSKISICSILCKLSWNTLAYVKLCCKNKDKNKTINKEEMFSESKFEQLCLSKIPGSASTYLAIVHPSGMASRGHLHVQSHKAVR